jgi:hypothetical protein
MKNYHAILFIAAAFIMGGCDKRVAVFNTIDTPPVLSFQKAAVNYTTLYDSIKKNDTSNYYPMILNVTAPTSQVSNLTYAISGETGHFTYRDLTITDGKLPTDYQNMNLNFFPDSLGTSDLMFTATNRFGKISSVHARVCYFDNIPPKPILSVTRTNNTTSYEYQIDGSGSYDGDAKFGGYIIGYTFTLDHQVIQTQRSSIKYIFPAPGAYTIVLAVKDNNNAIVSTTFTITVQ